MPKDKMRVAVAMSGGVDSSVAALLLHEQGIEVVGMSMHLYNLDLPDTAKFDTCCSLEDLDQARRVAEDVGFPHYVVDYEAGFRASVVRPFIEAYAGGRTPNPCVWCNDRVKFQPLLAHARRLGCTHLATGHYARIVERDGRFELWRPVDRRKDQTYFLFSLDESQLAQTLFPLGGLTKDQVRERARAAGLVTASKPESQDICFIPDGNIVRFLEQEIDETRPGRIVRRDGEVLGEHGGIHRYTIGQRRGLGVSHSEPLYVSELRPDTGDVVVSTRDELGRDGARIADVRWVNGTPDGPVGCQVQVRYRSRPVDASVVPNGATAEVWFDEGATEVVSPGQACVFYDGDRVLGGGWIEAGLDR